MNRKTEGLSDLSRRLCTYSLVIPLVVLLLFYRLVPAVQVVNLLAVAFIAGIGVWEYTRLMHAKKLHPPTNFLVFVGILEVFAIYAPPALAEWNQISVIILVLSVVALCVFYFDKIDDALVNIATGFFGVCYVAIPLGLMLRILYPPSLEFSYHDGIWWFVYLISVTKMTDVGAYFVGKFLGKHKLTKLSPKKTYEGAFAGLLTAAATSVAMYYIGRYYQFESFELTLARAVWLGALIGVLGQVGDLAESLLKRDAGVKDSNRLPGIGGVLDLLDSLLFTAPFTYFFIQGF